MRTQSVDDCLEFLTAQAAAAHDDAEHEEDVIDDRG